MFLSLAAGRFSAFLANRGSTLAKLKGQSVTGSGKSFHVAFIAIHLTVTLSLIFSSRVVRNQMEALLKIGPGYNTKQILVVDIPADPTLLPLLDRLKTSLSQLSFVSNASLAGPYSTPTNDIGWDIFTVDDGNQELWRSINYVQVDEDYFDLFNIQLKQGTTFKESDNSVYHYDKIIVNEALVKAMGWENPLEEYVSNYEIAGVVQNFNFYGLQRRAEPMIFRFNNDFPEKLLVKFSEATRANLQTVKDIWADNIEDHIHIATHLHPSIALASLVKDIKLASSGFIKNHAIFKHFSGWQDGYAAFTYSYRDKDVLIEYIKNQEKHHEKLTYKEELIIILNEHGVKFDEKYLL